MSSRQLILTGSIKLSYSSLTTLVKELEIEILTSQLQAITYTLVKQINQGIKLYVS